MVVAELEESRSIRSCEPDFDQCVGAGYRQPYLNFDRQVRAHHDRLRNNLESAGRHPQIVLIEGDVVEDEFPGVPGDELIRCPLTG